jgi:hypothetical protein
MGTNYDYSEGLQLASIIICYFCLYNIYICASICVYGCMCCIFSAILIIDYKVIRLLEIEFSMLLVE